MSVLYLHQDDCNLYNRCVMLLYTRMDRYKLCEYIGKLELLAADRQQLFFKIDVDILVPPTHLNIRDWLMVSVVMKSNEKKPIKMYISLFYQNFPYSNIAMDFYDERATFLASGDHNGNSLSTSDLNAYKVLSAYYNQQQKDVVAISREFRAQECSEDSIVDVIVGLAHRYKVFGGHWLMFFQSLPKNKYEQVFDYLLQAFCNRDVSKHSNRFNAKLSLDNLIISFGNELTNAATDPSVMHNRALCETRSLLDKDDNGVYEVRFALDRIYRAEVLGKFTMKYKPEIVSIHTVDFSSCCIQRDNIVRPTVYERSYTKWYYNWYNKQPNNMYAVSPYQQSSTTTVTTAISNNTANLANEETLIMDDESETFHNNDQLPEDDEESVQEQDITRCEEESIEDAYQQTTNSV